MRARAGSLVVAQPVFTPVAWVMFAESQCGVRIKDIVRERAQSMGIGSVGGIFVSTLVSLYFIPALCACRKSGSRDRLPDPAP